MMTLSRRAPLAALAMTALLLLLPLIARVARADVHDNANIFSADAVDKANAAMAQMQQKHNRGFVVETFPSIPDELKDQYQQQGKDKFFHEWMATRARSLQVNGVYALICMDPRWIIVDAGRQTRASGDFTVSDINRLKQQMQSAMHDQKYDDALLQAVDYVERAYTANINNRSAAS